MTAVTHLVHTVDTTSYSIVLLFRSYSALDALHSSLKNFPRRSLITQSLGSRTRRKAFINAIIDEIIFPVNTVSILDLENPFKKMVVVVIEVYIV